MRVGGDLVGQAGERLVVGGLITAATVKEQLLYEVTDPTGYITPDVVADFQAVRIKPLGADRVEVTYVVDGRSIRARRVMNVVYPREG